MFGESDSESPRVPSPWDSLISSSPDPAPSPVLHAVLPRLVPENDSGNVEYKLQLLSPSSARFARLVTQLKWRLLEGGGQAYYELGVADSGVLIGLSRAEMEATLETLEMMAGEIGASVVVVKEIEVPEAMVEAVQAQQAAGMLLGEDKWSRTRRRGRKKDEEATDASTTTTDATATSTASTTTDGEGEEDLSATVMLYRAPNTGNNHSPVPIFVMDPEPDPDPADNADCEQEEQDPDLIPSIVIDIEILSVFKPRPVRTRVHSAHLMNQAARNKRQKKHYKPPFHQSETQGEEGKKKGRHKRQFRDKKRTIDPPAPAPCSDSGSGSGAHSDSMSPSPSPSEVSIEPPTVALTTVEETDTLVSDLGDLHVSLAEIDENVSGVGTFMAPPTPAPTPASAQAAQFTQQESEAFVIVENDEGKSGENEGGDDDDDDIFPTPFIPNAGSLDEQGAKGAQGEDDGKRIIVEALVVRKMSLEEAFLDFGTFA